MGIVEAVRGKYDKAYDYFDTTKLILDSIGSEIDSLAMARFYVNYGLLATLNGRSEEGNEYFNIAESIYLKKFGPNNMNISDIYLNKGFNAFYNYDLEKTVLYYKKALDIYIANKRFKDRVPKTYANLAAVSLKLGDYRKAIFYSQQGLEFDPYIEERWRLYSNLSQAYMALNDEKQAVLYFQKAIKLQEEGNINPKIKISLYVAFANYMLQIHHMSESQKYYRMALNVIKSSYGRHSSQYADVLSHLGYFYLETSSVDVALDYFDASVRVWSESPDSSGLAKEMFNEVKYAETFIGRAKAYYLKYEETNHLSYLEAARNDIRMILNKMESLSGQLDKESRLLLNDEMKPAYDLAIAISYRLYHSEGGCVKCLQEAFEYSEKSKSAVLLASVRNLSALKTSGVPEEILLSEKDLNEEINGLRQMLVEEQQKKSPDKTKIEFFESKILELILDHDSLISKLEKDYPKYYSLKYDRSAISLENVPQKLDGDEAVLEYSINDTVVYIFSITKDETSLHKISLDSLFWQSMDYLMNVKNVDIGHLGLKEISVFYEHSNRIWTALIKPVYDQIHSKRLIIIPDGVLGYFPFEILAKETEDRNNLNFRSIPYLLKEFPVSYSYSLTLKFNPYFVKSEQSKNTVLAFAPEYERQGVKDSISRSYHLENLPYARDEARMIKKMLGGDVMIDEDATKENFLAKAGQYNILHLAMHTIINDSVPMLSKLVFTSVTNDTVSNLLNTYEIYDLNLKASMVTLSACNTGTGRLRTGEGIMSLARGFIYAGVPSIVMTLWEVQDKTGKELMREYYRNLLKGDTKDVALQKAKLSILQSSTMAKSHPFYWSAYIVTGDTKSLAPVMGKEYWYILAGVAMVILLLTLIYRQKRSGSTV
jgi:CHAT domain-containing protein/Tfp pilus assembly protein PilF